MREIDGTVLSDNSIASALVRRYLCDDAELASGVNSGDREFRVLGRAYIQCVRSRRVIKVIVPAINIGSVYVVDTSRNYSPRFAVCSPVDPLESFEGQIWPFGPLHAATRTKLRNGDEMAGAPPFRGGQSLVRLHSERRFQNGSITLPEEPQKD